MNLVRDEYKLSIIFLIFTTFFWGSTFVLVKKTIQIVPIDGFLSIRFLTSGVILFIFLVLTERHNVRELLHKDVVKYGAILGTLLYLSFLFQTIGLSMTTPAKAAFITGLNVILVPVVASIAPFNRKILRREYIYALVSLIGLGLMTLDFTTLTVSKGDLLILLTALAVAYHVVITERAANFPLIPLVTVQLFVVGLEATAVAIVNRSTWNPIQGTYPPVVWITLGITALLATAFAFWSQTYAQQQKVKPTEIAIIFSMEPVFALAIDLLVGTIPTLIVLAGMVLILSVTYISIRDTAN